MNPYLARIIIYPVKSLDGQEVEESFILRNAGLIHDREYCLLNEAGTVVNGKSLGEKLLKLRSEVNLAFGDITLRAGGDEATFHLVRDRVRLEQWFSERLGQRITLAHDPERGFPDDTDSPGPTLVSTATLEEVGSWFGLDAGETRRRFRPNLEIQDVPAFWEDRLFGARDQTVRFRIGDVFFDGVNPCARCSVPPRDSLSGLIPEPAFAKIFAERRKATLPAWADSSRFDHYYRLLVNTRVPESETGKTLQVRDAIDL